MLTRLIASRPASMGGRPVRVATSASVVLHVMMIGGWIALARSGALEPSAPDLTRVEYVGIADVERPAPVAEEAPPPVAETPTTKAPKYLPPTAMEVQGPVLDPAATAGFQELAPPKEVSGIPPEVAAQAVRAEDFGGRGMVGGSGSGARPEGPVATSASELVPGAPPGDGAPGAATVFDGGAVEVPPELVNDERVAMALRDLYPQSMREMGITADVIAEFTVDAKGRVERGSVNIVGAPNALFVTATKDAVAIMKFSPGRVVYNGELTTVRVRVRMPIQWRLQG